MSTTSSPTPTFYKKEKRTVRPIYIYISNNYIIYKLSVENEGNNRLIFIFVN